ncbi:MAG: hypothetical protein ACRD21_28565, partial [Vicinamibacteria bacterium]
MNDATRRFWEEMGGPTRDAVSIRGTELRRGSRVLVRPRSRGDVLDKMLEGKIGIVEGIDEDIDGNVLIVLTLEEDPGRDLGDSHFPGHRFYFATDEIEPILESNPPTSGRV